MKGHFNQVEVDKIVRHWIETSDEDFKTMMTLYDSNSFSWSLFLVIFQQRNYLKPFMLKNLVAMPPSLTIYTG